MNGRTAERHGRIVNGLQWAVNALVGKAVDVRVDRSRRTFHSKDCAERFMREDWMLRGRLLVYDAGLAGGDLRGPDMSGVAVAADTTLDDDAGYAGGVQGAWGVNRSPSFSVRRTAPSTMS